MDKEKLRMLNLFKKYLRKKSTILKNSLMLLQRKQRKGKKNGLKPQKSKTLKSKGLKSLTIKGGKFGL